MMTTGNVQQFLLQELPWGELNTKHLDFFEQELHKYGLKLNADGGQGLVTRASDNRRIAPLTQTKQAWVDEVKKAVIPLRGEKITPNIQRFSPFLVGEKILLSTHQQFALSVRTVCKIMEELKKCFNTHDPNHSLEFFGDFNRDASTMQKSPECQKLHATFDSTLNQERASGQSAADSFGNIDLKITLPEPNPL